MISSYRMATFEFSSAVLFHLHLAASRATRTEAGSKTPPAGVANRISPKNQQIAQAPSKRGSLSRVELGAAYDGDQIESAHPVIAGTLRGTAILPSKSDLIMNHHRTSESLFAIMLVIAAFAPLGVAQPGMLRTTTADGRINVAHASDLVSPTGLTCEAWFYLDPSTPGAGGHPTIIRNGPGACSYLFRISNGVNGNFGFAINLTNQGLFGFDPTTPVPQNSWHHYAATFDGAMVRMYLDGVQMLAQARPGTLFDAGGLLGLGGSGGSDETWRGNLDAIRIWSYARTQAQIQATMPIELTTYPGLVGSWNLNSNLLDSAGTHHGTISGGIALLPSTAPVTSTFLQSPQLAAIGTSVNFQVRTSFAFTPYVFDVSVSGSSPGIPLLPPLPNIPLNPPLLNFQLGGTLPPGLFTGFVGTTNSTGDATPSFALPNLPAIIGLDISAAFITLDPLSPFGIDKVSNGTSTHVTGPAPAISSISPSTVPQAGATSLVLNGSNFQAGATVRVNGVPATGVVLVNPSTIVCVAPSGTIGAATVQVLNPDGQLSPLASGLSYIPNLSIAGISVLTPAPNQLVFLSGTGFVSGMTLYAGAVLIPINSFSPTVLSFNMPQGARCNTLLTLLSPNGQNSAIPFNPSPLVSQVIGATGPAAGGGLVFILGDEFHPGTSVTIGGTPAAIQSISLTLIVVQAPPGSVGSAPIIIQSSSGCMATLNYVYQ